MKHILPFTILAMISVSTALQAHPNHDRSDRPNDRTLKEYERHDIELQGGRYSTDRVPHPRHEDVRNEDRRNDIRGAFDEPIDRDFSDTRYDGRIRLTDGGKRLDCEDGKCCTRPRRNHPACEDGKCSLEYPQFENRFEDLSRQFDRRSDFRFPRVRPGFEPVGAAEINWTTGLQQAADFAARENLPILVQVTADGCSHCQVMKRNAFGHSDVIRLLNQNYVAVQVNADRDRAFIEQMKIKSLPTTLIVAPNRQILERVEGARSAAQLLELLQRNRSAEDGR